MYNFPVFLNLFRFCFFRNLYPMILKFSRDRTVSFLWRIFLTFAKLTKVGKIVPKNSTKSFLALELFQSKFPTDLMLHHPEILERRFSTIKNILSHNHNTTIKIETLTLVYCYHLILGIHLWSIGVQIMSIMAKGSRSKSCVVMSL